MKPPEADFLVKKIGNESISGSVLAITPPDSPATAIKPILTHKSAPQNFSVILSYKPKAATRTLPSVV
jgi:hypothetical protein